MSQNVPELIHMKTTQKTSQSKSQVKRPTKRQNSRPKARSQARSQVRSTIRKNVRKQLAEWSLAIRTRDSHTCALCGRSTQSDSSLRPLRLNAHHILPKKFFPDVQFEMWNGVSLCPKCHTFGKFSAHKNGVFFAEWLKHHRPEQYEEVVNYLKLLNEAKS